jgi:hypothetical protein
VTFLHKTGSAVAPTPDKRTLTFANGTLSETIYPYASGSAPNYSFGTGTTTQLLTNVGRGTIDGVANIPIFRYYAYSNGVLGSALPTPLSAANAAKTVQVTVTFAASPSKTQVVDAGSSTTVSDSSLFRFSPANEDATATNLPCQ